MKTVLFSIIISLFGLFSTQNTTAATHNKTEVRTVSANFSGIRSEGAFDVVINNAPQDGRITLHGDASTLSKIIVEVKHHTLIIRRKRGVCLFEDEDYDKVQISLNAKNLKSIALSGSGNIVAKGVQQGASFAAVLSGSGNIKAQIETGEASLTMSGSGNLNLSGKADEAIITLSGSGNVKTVDLQTQDAQVVISGSGNAYIAVADNLNVTGIGSGDVHYKGNPSVDITTIGSGKLIQEK